MDCLFCRIIAGEIPSNKVYEDDECYAFYDIAPQARVHVVLVPKKHITALSEANEEDQALLGHLLLAANKIAAATGIAQSGYRVITNIGADACQSVKHLHLHVIGGEQLADKMA